MSLSNEEIYELEQLLYQEDVDNSKDDLFKFTQTTFKKFKPEWFHKTFYDILNRFAHKEIKNLIVTMPPQHGKKIIDSVLVLTTKGFKQHGNLKRGDFVFDRFGKPTKVLNVLNKSDKPDCEFLITFTDGQKIQCHAQHEWVVFDRSKGREIKCETQYLFSQKYFSGTFKKRCRFQVDSNYLVLFDKKELTIHPYFLGLWLGDGQVSAPTITHHFDDYKSIDKIISLGYKKTSFSVHKDTGVITSRFFGDTFQSFKKINFAHPKGDIKHIPLEYKLSTVNDRLELLAGLIDSDGYVYLNNGRVTFSNINKRLIYDVKDICVSLGFRTTICEFEPIVSTSGIIGRNKVYQLSFNPDIEIPTAIDRKKIILKNPLKRKRGIISIEKVKPKKGKCITVEGGVYLVGRNLIPTHNSEGSTRRLPSFLAGYRPDDKIAVVSYAATKAQKFGREIMTIMREKEYKDIFPNTKYPERGYTGAKSNTNIERESINSDGSMKFVGVDGPLTGDTVDVLILDDLYKGWKDANSPVTQRSVWDWYLTVADSRLHNDSQQLITFTRWSDQDVIAKLIELGLVVVYDGTEDLEEVIKNLDDKFLLINFQALKEGKLSEFDPRKEGDALWPDKHSKKKHESSRVKDPDKFDCLYQGNPQNKEGLLYSNNFKTYKDLPDLKIIKNYTDTADSGKDYLCSIVYGVPLASTDPHKYVIDVLYTQKGMEITEPLTAKMLNRNNVNKVNIESNGGGRGFARNLEKLVNKGVNIFWFHQSNNKEARIYSNSASVNNEVVFPSDWHIRWPVFYKHVTKYKKIFSANDFDDAQDTLTGIIEIEENTEVVHETEANADDLGLF